MAWIVPAAILGAAALQTGAQSYSSSRAKKSAEKVSKLRAKEIRQSHLLVLKLFVLY